MSAPLLVVSVPQAGTPEQFETGNGWVSAMERPGLDTLVLPRAPEGSYGNDAAPNLSELTKPLITAFEDRSGLMVVATEAPDGSPESWLQGDDLSLLHMVYAGLFGFRTFVIGDRTPGARPLPESTPVIGSTIELDQIMRTSRGGMVIARGRPVLDLINRDIEERMNQ